MVRSLACVYGAVLKIPGGVQLFYDPLRIFSDLQVWALCRSWEIEERADRSFIFMFIFFKKKKSIHKDRPNSQAESNGLANKKMGLGRVGRE